MVLLPSGVVVWLGSGQHPKFEISRVQSWFSRCPLLELNWAKFKLWLNASEGAPAAQSPV